MTLDAPRGRAAGAALVAALAATLLCSLALTAPVAADAARSAGAPGSAGASGSADSGRHAGAAADDPRNARTARTAPGDPADPAPPLGLDDVSPAALDPGEDLTVTVTLTPTSDVDDGVLTLALDRSIPISRSVLAAWQSGEDPSGHPAVETAELDEPLAAGESRTVELEVPADDLGLVEGVHEWGPRGLEVVLTDAGEVVEVLRTAVVWGAPAGSLEPLPVGLLVPATSGTVGDDSLVPGLGPDPAASDTAPATPPPDDDESASAESPSGEAPSSNEVPPAESPSDAAGTGTTTDTDAPPAGRGVLALADAIAGTGATLALDPVLLDGTGTAAGTALPELAEDDRLLALPAGDADLAALAHLDRPDLAQRLTSDGVDRIGVLTGHVVPSLAWPATEEVDTETVELAHDASAGVTVLPGPVLTPASDLTYTVSGRADVELGGARALPAPALVTEERASALLEGTVLPWSTGDETSLSDVQARQLLLADLAVVFRERPSDPRPLLLAYDRTTAPEAAVVGDVAHALADAPWVELTSLAELRLAPAASTDPLSLPDRVVGAGELGSAELERAEATERLAAAVATMTDPPHPVTASAALAVRTAVSAGWRDDPTSRETLVGGWFHTLTTATHAVRATPTSPINLIASTADLPVRVVNDGETDARVTVVVDPDDPRLEAPEGVEIVVPAGGQETALVPVSAIGSGDLPVQVRLVTPDGDQIGDAATIVVRVRAGWEGTGVRIAGLVLALLVVVGLVRRIRRGVRVPTGDATPVIAGDPGAPTVHVTGEQPAVTDDVPRVGTDADGSTGENADVPDDEDHGSGRTGR
ncbi:DUF6049 family protein [Georgenia sp. Z1344]|uniref:DUF6049 family protein n=1 Tax=Georgenia sp. Z1344 TaxID=3416706 RepID=UPI003CED4A74